MTNLEELWTQVPPSSSLAPAEVPPDSWLRSAIVLASSYVVPPTMNMITSCGLVYNDDRRMSSITLDDKRTVVNLHSLLLHPGRDSLYPSADPWTNSPVFVSDETYAVCRHSRRPKELFDGISGELGIRYTLSPFKAERPFASNDSVENKSSCRWSDPAILRTTYTNYKSNLSQSKHWVL